MAFTFKYGKAAAEYRPTDRLFTEFRDSRAQAPIIVPSVFGHGGTFKDWGMLGNDKWGDCVWAGAAHETELLTNLAEGGVVGKFVVKFDEKGVLSDYSAVTGFAHTDETDQGTNVHDAMDYRVKTGVVDSAGKRHKIVAYVSIEPGNLEHLRQALFIFEAVGIGFNVPRAAENQFANHQVWQVPVGEAANDIIGGHYVPLVGVPALGNLACVTWGRRQIMTDAFFKKYCDEAYAFITEDELNRKSHHNWGGFNWADLQADLRA